MLRGLRKLKMLFVIHSYSSASRWVGAFGKSVDIGGDTSNSAQIGILFSFIFSGKFFSVNQVEIIGSRINFRVEIVWALSKIAARSK